MMMSNLAIVADIAKTKPSPAARTNMIWRNNL